MNRIEKDMDRIRIIEATNNPLSADVVIIKGAENDWIYDVGSSEETFKELEKISNKNIVISHFHPDHMQNLQRLSFNNLYVGKNTYKYAKQGTIVETEMIFSEDNIRLIPMPSSHAKGSLALLAQDKCLLVGDAFYPQHKGEQRVYNVQHLKNQIDMLERLTVSFIGISHQKVFFQERMHVLERLQELFNQRKMNDPFIKL